MRGATRDDPLGAYSVVKSRRWDCPSCGLDKRNLIAAMCVAAGVLRMITLTFQQPLFRPGEFPPGWEGCDARDHVYLHERSGTQRWRIISTCPRCCARASHAMTLFRKRLRRRFGDQVQILWAREDHKSGALHLHLAVKGLPPNVTRFSRSGRWVKRSWGECDSAAGFVDVGRAGLATDDDQDPAPADPEAPASAYSCGRYLGKYLAKRHDQSMAKGYRRWSRTRDFGPEVRMAPPRDPVPVELLTDTDLEPLWLIGWMHPEEPVVLGSRWWPTADSPPV